MMKTNRKRNNAGRTTDALEMGDDLRFTRIQRRTSSGGAWVCGTIAGYRFDALVFAEHAECPDWELGDSRISKLWLARRGNKKSARYETAFHWERGLDTPATSPEAQAVVDFLAAHLANRIYG